MTPALSICRTPVLWQAEDLSSDLVRAQGIVFTFTKPGQLVVSAFGIAVAIGTLLLLLPFASADGRSAPFIDALFTATSAVCVTGLATVDTGTYWSGFGQAVILGLIQIGGLGIMVVATILMLVFARRLGLFTRMALEAETRTLSSSDLRRLVLRIVLFSVIAEVVVAAILAVRFALAYDMGAGTAVYSGVFHAVSAFNNAGFSLYSDSLVGFIADPWVLLPISAAVIVGGLGFPVVFELARRWRRPRSWSVLTRVTVIMTVSLLILGTGFYLVEEGSSPATLGGASTGVVFLGAFVTSVMARTAGFNVLDIDAFSAEALFTTDILMFIGGGSAGTAGGVKVTTIGLLALVVWSEMRGSGEVEIGRRRVSTANQRQALAVAVLGMSLVVVSTFILMSLTAFDFDDVLFEAVSAFATVGLSTGLTPEMPVAGKVVLIILMFVGRLGPLTVASGFALRERVSRRQYPEERMIIG